MTKARVVEYNEKMQIRDDENDELSGVLVKTSL